MGSRFNQSKSASFHQVIGLGMSISLFLEFLGTRLAIFPPFHVHGLL